MRDVSSKTYALMLKSRILGENPCNVDKIFHKIKQFGGPSRQGGGVSGIEIALWDLAGKAYGAPLYQLLGGKFRDEIRVYCDTDVDGKHTGHVCVEDCIRFAKRMEPYNLAWLEDMVPWIYTDQYVRLKNSTTIPICTGEDIYLKEGFEKIIKAGGVKMIKAVSAPYTKVRFMPTGGISIKNLADYLGCKAVFACGGSWMVPSDLINESSSTSLQRRIITKS